MIAEWLLIAVTMVDGHPHVVAETHASLMTCQMNGLNRFPSPTGLAKDSPWACVKIEPKDDRIPRRSD
jgi:hypothetical protein